MASPALAQHLLVVMRCLVASSHLDEARMQAYLSMITLFVAPRSWLTQPSYFQEKIEEYFLKN